MQISPPSSKPMPKQSKKVRISTEPEIIEPKTPPQTPPPSPVSSVAEKYPHTPFFFQMSPSIEIYIDRGDSSATAAQSSSTANTESENQQVNEPIPMPILPNGAPVPPAPTAPPSKKCLPCNVNTNYVVYFLLVCASLLAILIPTIITTVSKKD